MKLFKQLKYKSEVNVKSRLISLIAINIASNMIAESFRSNKIADVGIFCYLCSQEVV